jgi:hypothetical protein
MLRTLKVPVFCRDLAESFRREGSTLEINVSRFGAPENNSFTILKARKLHKQRRSECRPQNVKAPTHHGHAYMQYYCARCTTTRLVPITPLAPSASAGAGVAHQSAGLHRKASRAADSAASSKGGREATPQGMRMRTAFAFIQTHMQSQRHSSAAWWPPPLIASPSLALF